MQLASATELLRLPNRNEYDLVDGELRKLVVTGSEHDHVISRIVQLLYNWNEGMTLGVVVVGTGFSLSTQPDTVLTADVAFISKSQVDCHGISDSFFPEAPSFAVDVVAPADTAEELNDRILRWEAAGVKLLWSVIPMSRSVTVYRGLRDISRKSGMDALVGHEVLPNFACSVEDLF